MPLKPSRIFNNTDFFKGLLLTFAIVTPLVLAYNLDYMPVGLGMALGVLMCSASDVPGSFRHRVTGIFSASLLAGMVTLLVSFCRYYPPLLLPVIGLTVFAASYISVFGFRASLVSFAGLMAVVLSLAHSLKGGDIVLHALYIILGGNWYLLLSSTYHYLTEKKQTNLLLAECMELTAEYLAARRDQGGKEPSEHAHRLLSLQASLNDSHETLRELLLERRRRFGTSNYYNRQLLIFTTLVDLYELTLAGEGGLHASDEALMGNELPPAFRTLYLKVVKDLHLQAEGLRQSRMVEKVPDYSAQIQDCRRGITDYVEKTGLPAARHGALSMHNVLDYLVRISEKAASIGRVMQDLSDQKRVLPGTRRDRFITQQDYSLQRLRTNLDFHSPMFRHSLRMAIATMVGYLIGTVLEVQNAYWILLTIIVIMRPNYSLTRQRAVQRMYGTLIGAGIATAVILLTKNVYIYGAAGLISMVFAFTYIRKNYKASSVFITLNIIFIYVLIQPEAFTVVKFRVIDTLTGALIAFLANKFLLPSWEYEGISKTIREAVKANGEYLKKVAEYYNTGGEISVAYRMARKQAFLAVGNLNAAFQRMSQDPKNRQPELSRVYEITALNQNFLTATASLGAYIRHHPTGIAGEAVNLLTADITLLLEQAINHEDGEVLPDGHDAQRGASLLESKFGELASTRDREIAGGYREISQEMLLGLQEIKIIRDQLGWLYNMADNLHSITQSEKGRKTTAV